MPSLKPGDVIAGRYRIGDALGRGGMGVVYQAIDQQSGQRLAFKTLLPQYLTNTRAVQRFIQEVNVIRQLNHPCIVRIMDARQIDDLLFYTMEFVEGKSLRSWMKGKKRFGMGSTMRVLTLLCGALEHAHQYTIHRDLSPENVMITPEGGIKLLDFGLAKLMNTDSSFTRVGISLGKVQYIAPEQRSDAKNVDHRADLYSLGVMFYEMLSGELPIHGKPLSALRPELPQECDTFVEKALAAEPEARFGSASEFQAALARLYELSKIQREKSKTPIDIPSAVSGRSNYRPGLWDRIRLYWRGLLKR